MTYDEKIEWIGFLGTFLINGYQNYDHETYDKAERLPYLLSSLMAEVDATRPK
jgi:hypothetical protein